MSPTVSAIIIFLNGETYLREAIDSVIAQTFTDWELILCDDGSAAPATMIAKEYARRHPDKIRYIDHPGHENRGMSATRMLGVAHSTGRYIAWLDADDVWLRGKLEHQVSILESHREAAMVYGPLTYWYSWAQQPTHRDVQQNLGVELDALQAPPTVFLKFVQNIEHHPSGVMVRRDVLNAVGGYEPAFRRDYEDVVAQTKTCLNYPVYASSQSHYLYRQHESSCCAAMNQTGRARASRLTYLRWLERYLADRPHDPAVRAALQRELEPYSHKVRYLAAQTCNTGVQLARRAAKGVARTVLPRPLRTWMRAAYRGHDYVPPPGWVRFGSLRRGEPMDREWGWHRGLPVDRYYIESFLRAHQSDIKGRVLEVADSRYTRRFGAERVEQADVLHVTADNALATIVGNLETGENIPVNAYDCIVLTQVLPFLFDVRAAVRNCCQALRPGGVLLLTVPGISQVSREDRDSWGDFWRFTSSGVRRLLGEAFGADRVQCRSYGNALVATSFLYGMASQELHQRELDRLDDQYELIIAARAVKPDREGELP